MQADSMVFADSVYFLQILLAFEGFRSELAVSTYCWGMRSLLRFLQQRVFTILYCSNYSGSTFT